MIYLLGLYLVGYCISFGMALAVIDKKDGPTFMTAFVISFLSWINVGTAIGDFIKKYLKEDEHETITP